MSLYLSQYDIQHNIEVRQFEDMKKLKKISPSNLECKPWLIEDNGYEKIHKPKYGEFYTYAHLN